MIQADGRTTSCRQLTSQLSHDSGTASRSIGHSRDDDCDVEAVLGAVVITDSCLQEEV